MLKHATIKTNDVLESNTDPRKWQRSISAHVENANRHNHRADASGNNTLGASDPSVPLPTENPREINSRRERARRGLIRSIKPPSAVDTRHFNLSLLSFCPSLFVLLINRAPRGKRPRIEKTTMRRDI